jgi:predicted site-specific integrase-resolvase
MVLYVAMSQTALLVMLMRRRDAAEILAVSESQILKWEREGLLHPISMPGIRAIRYRAEEVRALAQRFIDHAHQATEEVAV